MVSLWELCSVKLIPCRAPLFMKLSRSFKKRGKSIGENFLPVSLPYYIQRVSKSGDNFPFTDINDLIYLYIPSMTLKHLPCIPCLMSFSPKVLLSIPCQRPCENKKMYGFFPEFNTELLKI